MNFSSCNSEIVITSPWTAGEIKTVSVFLKEGQNKASIFVCDVKIFFFYKCISIALAYYMQFIVDMDDMINLLYYHNMYSRFK